MTTWLRLIGASITGILDPVPSNVTSPMTEADALLQHRLHALAEGGSLRVVAITPPIQRLLEITGTTGLLPRYAQVDRAVLTESA